jgi:hypothetical protein
MTTSLDQAIAELRALPEAEQDWAAENIRALMRERERGGDYHLTPEQVEKVKRTLADLDEGRTRLLTEEETEQMWRRLGV